MTTSTAWQEVRDILDEQHPFGDGALRDACCTTGDSWIAIRQSGGTGSDD